MTWVYHHYVQHSQENYSAFRRALGLTQQSIADCLQVTVQTVRRWERESAPFWAVEIIYLRSRSPAAHGEEWQGWYFENGYLVTPEGDSYRPGEIRAIQFMRQGLDIIRDQRRSTQPRPKFNENKIISVVPDQSKTADA